MIKVEIGQCIDLPIEGKFKIGEFYPLVPGKNGGFNAYNHPDHGFHVYGAVTFKICRHRFNYHHHFFKPVKELFFKNYAEVKEFKKKFFENPSQYLRDDDDDLVVEETIYI